MANDHKPTARIDSSGEASEWSSSPAQYDSGIPACSMGGATGYGYGSSPSPSGANKTERLHVAPPTFGWFVIVEGVHAGHIFRLHPDSTTIGRDPSCDIVLDDTAASRQHAKVRVINRDKKTIFVLHDLATENCTTVNDEEIAKHELTDGDSVLIGRTKLIFKQIQV